VECHNIIRIDNSVALEVRLLLNKIDVEMYEELHQHSVLCKAPFLYKTHNNFNELLNKRFTYKED